METNDPVLKARAIYNNANLIATDMDFSTAAMQYAEVLKIDANDFRAKKKSGTDEIRVNNSLIPCLARSEEREDRIEALKLISMGARSTGIAESKKSLVIYINT